MNDSKIIVALDFPNAAQALTLVDQLEPELCKLKVGKELFTAEGQDLVRELVKRGFKVFLDLKFHDIPNTVASACSVAADLGVWMMNVHASGGRKMMETAANRLAQLQSRPLLIGVTILTSLSEEEIHEIGYTGTPEDNVLRLAKLAESSGLDGVVCSPLEAAPVREVVNDSFQLVTPGVRPVFASTDDQKRIMTPADALKAGASYLVIGRPITAADDPMKNLQLILEEITA
jgi:orotidine-5'-phosphate decarboxylase